MKSGFACVSSVLERCYEEWICMCELCVGTLLWRVDLHV